MSRAQLSIILRVLLGGIFIWAGCAKVIDLPAFVESVGHFEMKPFTTAPWDMWIGYTLPAFELIVGSCLILGFLYRGAIVASFALSLIFFVAIYSVHSRGLNIECGCLGKALSFGNYYIHLSVLAAMVIASLILAWIEHRPYGKRDI